MIRTSMVRFWVPRKFCWSSPTPKPPPHRSFMEISKLYTYQKFQFKAKKTVAFFEVRWKNILGQVNLLTGYLSEKNVRVVWVNTTKAVFFPATALWHFNTAKPVLIAKRRNNSLLCKPQPRTPPPPPPPKKKNKNKKKKTKKKKQKKTKKNGQITRGVLLSTRINTENQKQKC